MNVLVFSVLGAVLVVLYSVPVYTQANRARLFLKFNNKSDTYELNPDVLGDIAKLQRPVRVVAVLGVARVGKSTSLNLINHAWTGMYRNRIEEIFQTGDSLAAVTHDVWAHIIQRKDGYGSVLLLDVEGTDLGDDGLTDHLSMFTTLISSGLSIMVHDVFGSKNLDFLYRVSRLSEQVFRNFSHDNFPRLRVVIRGGLRPPDGRSLDDYTLDSIVEPSFEESMQNERKIIAKHFPRANIAVTQIPFVGDRHLFTDFERLRGSDYWRKMTSLAEHFKAFPAKKTLEGSPIDGIALAELAVQLVKTMNENSWPGFGNVYVMIERNICSRSYAKLVEPVFLLTADKITAATDKVLDKFKMECALESEIAAAREDLRRISESKRQLEETGRNLAIAEKKGIETEKTRVEEENKFKAMFAVKNEELKKEKKAQEDAEKERQHLQQLHQEAVKSIEILKQQFGSQRIDWTGAIGSALFGGLIAGLLSDERLKGNITVLPRSQYNAIGFAGVSWEWNELAQTTFGLRGEGYGVIAQEVEKLYPWAVTRGEDGYLRVQYTVLHAMINDCETKTCPSQKLRARVCLS